MMQSVPFSAENTRERMRMELQMWSLMHLRMRSQLL